MVKKASGTVSIDRNLLSMIAAASAQNQFYYVTQAEGVPLVQAGYIEVNTAEDMMKDGKAPSRITPAGAAYLGSAVSNPSPASSNGASQFGLMKGVEVPASKRGVGLKGGGAPKKYPFDQMEVGDTFFVPVSEAQPDPVKTLGSTVSSANLRYAEQTGTQTKTRAKRGKKNKALLDATGNKIMETVEVPVYKYTRKFVIRAIEGGKQYGSWTAPSNGALIARQQ